MKRILFSLAAFLAFACGQTVYAATNITLTGPKQVSVGQTFQVVVEANAAVDVDTVRLNGSYTQDIFDWKAIAPAGVFQSVSPGTSLDPTTGVFSFGTYTFNATANGNIRLAVITLTAKKVGTGDIQLASTSKVLSAGVEQIGSVGRINITVTSGPVIQQQPQPLPATVPSGKTAISLTSSSQPNPNLWYASRQVNVSWDILGKTVKSVMVGFDQNPSGPADLVPTDSSAKFTAANDGVWYVHLLVTFTDGSTQRADLRIQIDASSPHRVTPTVDQTQVPATVPNFVRYGTTDDASGISHYDILIDGALVTSTVLQVYPLTGLAAGSHEVTVRAFDQAGNQSEGSTTFTILVHGVTAPPTITSVWVISLILILIGLMLMRALWVLLYGRKDKKTK